MLTITQPFLDQLPEWAAAGWQVGDTLNLANLCANHDDVKTFLANHPPVGPHH